MTATTPRTAGRSGRVAVPGARKRSTQGLRNMELLLLAFAVGIVFSAILLVQLGVRGSFDVNVITLAGLPTDPADTVAAALDELGLGPTDVTLALGHGDALVHGDPVLLQRVLVNLLANAHRFSGPGSPVLVSTSTFGDRLEIRVVDHGPGVAADRREDMFLPFQRLGDTDNSTGLGLGLALARGFVEAMHGTLAPEDTPGGGLTMVISLPTATAPLPDPPEDLT